MTSGATPPPGRTGPLCQVQPSSETSPPPRVPKVYHLPSDSVTVQGSWMNTSPASCAPAGVAATPRASAMTAVRLFRGMMVMVARPSLHIYGDVADRTAVLVHEAQTEVAQPGPVYDRPADDVAPLAQGQ